MNLENNLLYHIATKIQNPLNKLKFKEVSKRIKKIPNMNNIQYKKGFEDKKNFLLKKHPRLGMRSIRTVKTGLRNAKNNAPYYWYRAYQRLPNGINIESKTELGKANALQHYYDMGWDAIKGSGASSIEKKRIRELFQSNVNTMLPYGLKNVFNSMSRIVGRSKAMQNYMYYFHPKLKRIHYMKKQMSNKENMRRKFSHLYGDRIQTRSNDTFNQYYNKVKKDYNQAIELSKPNAMEKYHKKYPLLFGNIAGFEHLFPKTYIKKLNMNH